VKVDKTLPAGSECRHVPTVGVGYPDLTIADECDVVTGRDEGREKGGRRLQRPGRELKDPKRNVRYDGHTGEIQ
jgi:hypothetical protein